MKFNLKRFTSRGGGQAPGMLLLLEQLFQRVALRSELEAALLPAGTAPPDCVRWY